jgi:uncharacterized DUF497 family protein
VRVSVEFDWDPRNAEANERKHRVRFEVAVKVFADPYREDFDPREGDGEVRRKVVGRVNDRLLSLVYPVRDGVFRVISARQANVQERRRYGYR